MFFSVANLLYLSSYGKYLKLRCLLMEALLNVQPALEDPSPRVKPVPKTQHHLRHVYHPSGDGTDENLLILLHGLGKLS